MMLWTVFIILSLSGVVFAAWPLWRKAHRLTPLVATVIVFTVGSSAYLYNRIGSPDVPSGRSLEQNHNDMSQAIAGLKERLARNPNDIAGWNMLGRSQMSTGDFAGAVETYEKVMELDEGKVAQSMVDLALALLNRDQQPIQGRTSSLLESALALEPNNPSALFYAGFGAAERGDTDTAAERWEKLLGLNPPENIRGILVQRIAEWRGEEVPAMPPQHPPVSASGAAEEPAPDAVVSARIALSDEALSAMPGDASVFVIARDPAIPTPPIAVTRIRLSELPKLVSLTDASSMVEGRNLSAFPEIELLARVSLSGTPAAASGDWFGSMIVRPAENNSVFLTIDQQVP